jgi:nitrogen fixation protein NifU and related proteins
MTTADMYRENILDHYKHPRNRGKLEGADSSAHDSNPLCGDEVTYYLKFSSGRVSEIKFDGTACAICLASASMLSEEAAGKKIEEARELKKERVLSLLGIDPGPMRLKCALLPLKVFKLALYKHLGKKMSEEDEKLV